MRAGTTLRNRHLPLILLAVGLVWVTLVPQSAADQSQCPSSKAASELVSCRHCQVLKELMRGAEGSVIHFDVFDLQHGVVIQLAGGSEAAVTLIKDVVDEIWAIHADAETVSVQHFCPDCAKRNTRLVKAQRDRAFTDTGAVVVLTSDDQAVVEWLRRDALQYQSWLETADASH